MEIIIVSLLVIGFVSVVVVVNKMQGKGINNVRVSDVVELLKEKDLLILDVRTKDEYKEGHIKNARNIAVQSLPQNVSSLLNWKEKNVLVYCHSGGRSAVAGQILKKNGFIKISNMIGGVSAWSVAGYQVVK